MNNLTKTIIGILSAVIVLLGGYTATQVGSVTVGNEYKYAQYSGAIATSTLIRTGTAVLGSVIITEDSATAVTFWDATSTEAVTAGVYATKVAVMQAALTEGTYTFDLQLDRGLVMVSTDGYTFAGDWTVTYR